MRIRRATWAAAAGLAVVWLSGCDAILGIHKPHDRVADDSGGIIPEASSDDGPPAADGSLAPDGGGDEGGDVAVPPDGAVEGGSCVTGQLPCPGGCMAPTDIRSCGSCGNDCTQLPNVSAAGLACDNGHCVYGCFPGYADCADAGAGCPTYLGDNPNCGACGISCPSASPFCQRTTTAGVFGCVPKCLDPTPTACNRSCIDEKTDNRNCGGCGASFACTGAQTCQGGVCGCLPCVLDQSNLDQCCLQ
jgi:hypothetical protein